ncbi:MAG: hypothetical protein CMLOHMNK_02122 [Steroidobacteraceae bacterium]|nr:hypothetical protein [Steroidobacteraceae bacterium]
MQFSESNDTWRLIPPWADFLIRLGHGWPASPSGRERICLVSMPCDSAAAGLIALGAMIRDLGNPRANDLDGHYDDLCRYADEYLGKCGRRDREGQVCEERCDPQAVRCGLSERIPGLLRSEEGELYRISGKGAESQLVPGGGIICTKVIGRGRAKRPRNKDLRARRDGDDPGSRWVLPSRSLGWHIDGNPPAQLESAGQALQHDPYEQIIPGAHVLPENLSVSYSGLCLASRAAGGKATREACEEIRFRTDDGRENTLVDLLAVTAWASTREVSRVLFFNSRTGEMDRRSRDPRIVIADGPDSFLRALQRFKHSDIIGVMHRAVDREVLEEVGVRMQNLEQWYEADVLLAEAPRGVPHGISTLTLRRRAR